MRATVWLVLWGMIAVGVGAVVPAEIGYQGRMLDATGAPVDGVVSLSFALFDVSIGLYL